MAIKNIEFENFTAFKSLKMSCSPGINVIVGENGAGKTHIMKAAYAAASVSGETKPAFGRKLADVFLPAGGQIGRLVHRQKKSSKTNIKVIFGEGDIAAGFSNHTTIAEKIKSHKKPIKFKEQGYSVYIPVKEILSNAPGFRSIYEEREISFDATYDDILKLAYLPAIRGKKYKVHKDLLEKIEQAISGKVIIKGEHFYLRNQQGNLEFSLVAEGWRKLALVWQLIQNGVLWNGSILFWDEPETNLHPKLMKSLVEIFIELQRQGVQIFIATHNLTIVKWLELSKKYKDNMKFHALLRQEDGISLESAESFEGLENESLSEAFSDIFDEELSRTFADV